MAFFLSLGMNDGGASYEHRAAAQQLFLDFLDEPAESARRSQVRKRHFLSTLCILMIVLPRQAWDKHMENSKKSAVFSQGGLYTSHWCV
eukprot:COSAG06_NODE_689_length_13068_cov_9.661269_3_plen_89_part_00